MRIKLQNIGMISDCDVEINGITVIAGNNNTGKSTISKTLFSVFNSSYKIEEQIKNERVNSVYNYIRRVIDRFDFDYYHLDEIKEGVKDIVNNKNNYIDDIGNLNEKLRTIVKNEYIDNEVVSSIEEKLKVSDEELANSIFKKRFSREFGNQIKNTLNNNNGYITLRIKNHDLNLSIDDNQNISVKFPIEFSLQKEAIYIDNPFVLDENKIYVRRKPLYDHENHLISKLLFNVDNNAIDEILATKKLDKIYEKINSICGGKIVYGENGLLYEKNNNSFNVHNLSAGLKSFVILKTLLLNGTIVENGTIILDEPEIHLHPEWQLLFAELIVLLQKEFGLHILLNTHSPYFLDALYIYSKKYNVDDKCKYYLTIAEDNGSKLIDVTKKEEEIFKMLVKPFKDLENERNEFDD